MGTVRLQTTASCTSVRYYACMGNKSLITQTKKQKTSKINSPI